MLSVIEVCFLQSNVNMPVCVNAFFPALTTSIARLLLTFTSSINNSIKGYSSVF